MTAAQRFILLISEQADDATFVSEVAARSNCRLEVAPSLLDAIDFIADFRPSAIFLDVGRTSDLNEFESELQKKFGLFSDFVKPSNIHFVSNRDITEAREIVQSPYFANFYRRPTHDISKAAAFYSKLMQANESEDMTVESFLESACEVQKVEVNHTSQKQEAVEAVRQYLISAKIPARIANLLANSIDELLMNALFDAPADEFGKPLYSSTLRTQERDLKGKEVVEMYVGFDGKDIVVRVVDHYGSVDRQRLVSHISKNYKNQGYTLKAGSAGAGLGMASVYRSGPSLIYQCAVKAQTQVTLLGRVYPSYAEFKTQFRFLSVRFDV
jgi:hypothetical protein